MSKQRTPTLTRRLRVSNALIAVWFVCLSGVLAVIADDIAAGVVSLALFAAGYAVGVIWMGAAGLLPRGSLTKVQTTVVLGMLMAAAVFGVVALTLAIADNRPVGTVVAVIAAGTSVFVGVIATWLAVR